MEDQYGMADLRQYISHRPIFPPIPPPPDLLSTHRGPHHPYDMLIFRSDSASAGASSSAAAAGFGGFEGGMNGGGGDGGGCDGGAGRWPRQETLTLLEIRSRLDPKFKEANQKGPLWDEVSRIMCEEHGYQRSGKKCREKFENLYKYYKKTKEGKAGRQDGKHYRFFRQLEALYGEANSSASMSEAHASYKAGFVARGHDPRVSDTSLSLSNCSDEADTSSSEEDGESGGMMKMKKRGGNWKAKIREFIDGQMKKLMEKQEAWMEKMMSAIEDKERERAMREEEWRRQDAARIEREHKFWASERAWIEARDAALMEALHKFTSSKEESMGGDSGGGGGGGGEIWPESEINRLIQLTTAMEGKFEQRGAAEEMVWEEIASKMGCYGHERSGAMCREKWESINNYVLKCSKKRKDNPKNCTNYGGGGGGGMYCDNSSEQGNNNGYHHHHHHHHQNLSLSGHDHGGSSPNPNANPNAAINESCFRYFMGDGYGRIID